MTIHGTDATAETVVASFALLEGAADRAGTLMYGRLFETVPEVLPQFRRDLSEPNLRPAATHRFMQLITFIRSAAECTAEGHAASTRDTVQRLAQRHVGYRTEAAHYAPLREAMLWSLDQCLGGQFTPVIRRAWGEAYDRLTSAMVEPLATAAPTRGTAEPTALVVVGIPDMAGSEPKLASVADVERAA